MCKSIKELLKEPENKTLEFKQDLSSIKPIIKTIVAFMIMPVEALFGLLKNIKRQKEATQENNNEKNRLKKRVKTII